MDNNETIVTLGKHVFILSIGTDENARALRLGCGECFKDRWFEYAIISLGGTAYKYLGTEGEINDTCYVGGESRTL